MPRQSQDLVDHPAAADVAADAMLNDLRRRAPRLRSGRRAGAAGGRTPGPRKCRRPGRACRPSATAGRTQPGETGCRKRRASPLGPPGGRGPCRPGVRPGGAARRPGTRRPGAHLGGHVQWAAHTPRRTGRADGPRSDGLGCQAAGRAHRAARRRGRGRQVRRRARPSAHGLRHLDQPPAGRIGQVVPARRTQARRRIRRHWRGRASRSSSRADSGRATAASRSRSTAFARPLARTPPARYPYQCPPARPVHAAGRPADRLRPPRPDRGRGRRRPVRPCSTGGSPRPPPPASPSRTP